MSDTTYDVDLHLRWERNSTYGDDVRYYAQDLRWQLRHRVREEFPGARVSLQVRHGCRNHPLGSMQYCHGTARVQMPMKASSERQAIERARFLLVREVRETFCRAPDIEVV